MKKMIAMAAVAITMMMASCSGDDSSNTNEPGEFGLLLAKSVETYGDGETSTLIYSYDGNKITGYTDNDGYDIDYTYSDGLLTKIETFIDNDLFEKIILTYDGNNKLSTKVKINGNELSAFKTVYDYNNDGTVLITHYIGNPESQTEPAGTGLVTMVDGNITSVTHYEADGSEIYTQNYTFDTKHTPFKNVFAHDILVLANVMGGTNNVLTSSTEVFPDNVVEFEYTYNSENLPTTMATIIGGEVSSETEYTYE